MRVFSTFTGIGGFEFGINRAAIKVLGEGINHIDVVGYSEIDKYAIQVYDYWHKGVKNYGDITKINAEALPDFDCLVGGFPCQAFSIAGRRGGFNDTRGTLFFDLARILRAKQPELFVFENVKGLLSHDRGRTFRTIIATITELGYDCQWQVLNSKDWGVPQNRERIIIVGHLRDQPRPQVFPIEGAGGKDLVTINSARHDYDRVYASEGVAPALNTGQRGNAQPKVIQRPRGKNNGGAHDIAPTLTGKSYQDNNHVVSFNRKEGVGKKLEVAHALQAGDYRGLNRNQTQNAVIGLPVPDWETGEINPDSPIRKFTPLECERLQGFPDNWTKFGVDQNDNIVQISDTQRYKLCGNAVTTNVIQAVFERLLA